MGLLDDAIREHLELKRLRGADPGEVAREERDALGGGSRAAEAGQGMPVAMGSGVSTDADPSVLEVSEPLIQPSAGASTGQETVEINMEAELDYRQTTEEPIQEGGQTAAVGPPAHARSEAEESLEWEAPGDGRESSGDRADHDDAQQSEDKVGQLEDVLEETPDFLRETPEQDRLWFEQRPPRDFDFNE